MARDIRRFNKDIELACQAFGPEKVFWAQDAFFVIINEFKLPPNFKKPQSNLLILVPDNYGYGGCFRDVFIDPDLELLDRSGNTYRKLDRDIHGFREYPYSSMSSALKTIFQDRGWFYLCLHDKNPKSSIVNYLFKVGLFLANPYKDWKSINEYYRNNQ